MTFETTVGIRYADLDTYGHVNNAVYGTLIEEARIDYLEAAIPEAIEQITGSESPIGIVLANLELDFERPLRPTDDVTVAVEVPSLGDSSIPFEYEISDDHGLVATGETTVVVIDREAGTAREIPEQWRAGIDSFEGR